MRSHATGEARVGVQHCDATLGRSGAHRQQSARNTCHRAVCCTKAALKLVPEEIARIYEFMLRFHRELCQIPCGLWCAPVRPTALSCRSLKTWTMQVFMTLSRALSLSHSLSLFVCIENDGFSSPEQHPPQLPTWHPIAPHCTPLHPIAPYCTLFAP